MSAIFVLFFPPPISVFCCVLLTRMRSVKRSVTAVAVAQAPSQSRCVVSQLDEPQLPCELPEMAPYPRNGMDWLEPFAALLFPSPPSLFRSKNDKLSSCQTATDFVSKAAGTGAKLSFAVA